MINSEPQIPKLIITVCLYDQYKVESVVKLTSVLNSVYQKYYNVYITFVLNTNINFNKEIIENNTNMTVLKGENTDAEFGAWQEGLNHLKNQHQLKITDKFIFFNDTVFHHFFPNLPGLLKFFSVVSQDSFNPIISGELVKLNATGAVCGEKINHYICSAFFYLNHPALEKLDFKLLNVSSVNLDNQVFRNSYEMLLNYFDEDVLAYEIGLWLFGGYWYKSKKYQEFDKKLLHLKLTMIANEKFMSAKLQNHNCQFINSIREKMQPINILNHGINSILVVGFINTLRVFDLYIYGLKKLIAHKMKKNKHA